MNRLISIDIAKAICIILVVIGHYNPDNAPRMVSYNQSVHLHVSYAFVHVCQWICVRSDNRESEGGGEFLYKKFNG